MATNDFLPFATGGSADVMSQADYLLASFVANGFSTGIAETAELNKVWRQSSFVAAAIAQWIVDQTGADVLDNADLSSFVAKFATATQINPGFAQFNSSGSLPTSAIGKTVVLGGSGGTLQLPAGSTMPDGGKYPAIFAQGGAWTLQTAGGDVVSIGALTGGASVTSFGMSGSDFCTLQWSATGGSWIVSSGTPMLAAGGGVFATKAPLPKSASSVGQWTSVLFSTNLMYVPSGGTWAYFASNNGTGYAGILGGGSAIYSGTLNNAFGFCWRIA